MRARFEERVEICDLRTKLDSSSVNMDPNTVIANSKWKPFSLLSLLILLSFCAVTIKSQNFNNNWRNFPHVRRRLEDTNSHSTPQNRFLGLISGGSLPPSASGYAVVYRKDPQQQWTRMPGDSDIRGKSTHFAQRRNAQVVRPNSRQRLTVSVRLKNGKTMELPKNGEKDPSINELMTTLLKNEDGVELIINGSPFKTKIIKEDSNDANERQHESRTSYKYKIKSVDKKPKAKVKYRSKLILNPKPKLSTRQPKKLNSNFDPSAAENFAKGAVNVKDPFIQQDSRLPRPPFPPPKNYMSIQGPVITSGKLNFHVLDHTRPFAQERPNPHFRHPPNHEPTMSYLPPRPSGTIPKHPPVTRGSPAHFTAAFKPPLTTRAPFHFTSFPTPPERTRMLKYSPMMTQSRQPNETRQQRRPFFQNQPLKGSYVYQNFGSGASSTSFGYGLDENSRFTEPQKINPEPATSPSSSTAKSTITTTTKNPLHYTVTYKPIIRTSSPETTPMPKSSPSPFRVQAEIVSLKPNLASSDLDQSSDHHIENSFSSQKTGTAIPLTSPVDLELPNKPEVHFMSKFGKRKEGESPESPSESTTVSPSLFSTPNSIRLGITRKINRQIIPKPKNVFRSMNKNRIQNNDNGQSIGVRKNQQDTPQEQNFQEPLNLPIHQFLNPELAGIVTEEDSEAVEQVTRVFNFESTRLDSENDEKVLDKNPFDFDSGSTSSPLNEVRTSLNDIPYSSSDKTNIPRDPSTIEATTTFSTLSTQESDTNTESGGKPKEEVNFSQDVPMKTKKNEANLQNRILLIDSDLSSGIKAKENFKAMENEHENHAYSVNVTPPTETTTTSTPTTGAPSVTRDRARKLIQRPSLVKDIDREKARLEAIKRRRIIKKRKRRPKQRRPDDDEEDIEIYDGVSVVQIPSYLRKEPHSSVNEPGYEELSADDDNSLENDDQQTLVLLIEESADDFEISEELKKFDISTENDLPVFSVSEMPISIEISQAEERRRARKTSTFSTATTKSPESTTRKLSKVNAKRPRSRLALISSRRLRKIINRSKVESRRHGKRISIDDNDGRQFDIIRDDLKDVSEPTTTYFPDTEQDEASKEKPEDKIDEVKNSSESSTYYPVIDTTPFTTKQTTSHSTTRPTEETTTSTSSTTITHEELKRHLGQTGTFFPEDATTLTDSSNPLGINKIDTDLNQVNRPASSLEFSNEVPLAAKLISEDKSNQKISEDSESLIRIDESHDDLMNDDAIENSPPLSVPEQKLLASSVTVSSRVVVNYKGTTKNEPVTMNPKSDKDMEKALNLKKHLENIEKEARRILEERAKKSTSTPVWGISTSPMTTTQTTTMTTETTVATGRTTSVTESLPQFNVGASTIATVREISSRTNINELVGNNGSKLSAFVSREAKDTIQDLNSLDPEHEALKDKSKITLIT